MNISNVFVVLINIFEIVFIEMFILIKINLLFFFEIKVFRLKKIIF